MKHRIPALLLALALCLTLCACGGTDSNEPADNNIPATDTPVTDAPATDTPDVDGSETGDFTRGTVADGVYINEFLGLNITLPDGWTAADDETIASVVSVGMDHLQNITEEQKAVAVSGTIYDAVLFSDTGFSIMVMAEDLATTAGTTLLTAEAYAELLHSNLQAMTDLGYELQEPTDFNLAGTDYVRMDASVPSTGVSQLYLIRWVSGYMLSVSVTADSIENCEALLANFQPLA